MREPLRTPARRDRLIDGLREDSATLRNEIRILSERISALEDALLGRMFSTLHPKNPLHRDDAGKEYL